MKRNRLYLALSVAALLAALTGGAVQQAAAGAEVCTPCVILIEVDGLEPKDVTPQTTPFLWALAHPNIASEAAGNATDDPPNGAAGDVTAAIAAAQTPGIQGRHGFTWLAGRATMGASAAADTTSLLQGSYADYDGIPADHYWAKESGGLQEYKLGGPIGEESDVKPPDHMGQSIPELMDEGDNKYAAFVGDPKLAEVATGNAENATVVKPETQDSVPAFCTPPANQDEASTEGTQFSASEASCPTLDINTINKAYTDLVDNTKSGKVSFAYIYLAQLGAEKRLHGDIDSSNPANLPVQSALADTDAAIGYFVNRYNQDSDKWPHTVLFITGSHGYELTPVATRVPDPLEPTDPGLGLEEYVQSVSNSTETHLASQGTMATVYVKDDTADKSKVKAVYNGLKTEVNAMDVCNPTGDANGGCIDEVLFTDPALDPDQLKHSNTVQSKHPSWHLHALDDATGAPTGSDGDLIVTFKPGWTADAVTPASTSANQTDPYNGESGTELDNPFVGSAGGPRNRPVAVVVNGPSSGPGAVNQIEGFTGGRYPIGNAAVEDDLHCPRDAAAFGTAQTEDVNAANATPEDDANIIGHQCQPETVDFAPSIAALLRLAMPDKQLAGRFLNEAFESDLVPFKEDEVLPPPPPVEPPPPPEPDIYIPPPPQQSDPFPFRGFFEKVNVQVTDSKGCAWSKARPGVKLDYLKIQGDFGKDFSAVSLTFYKPAAEKASKKKARSSSVTVPLTRGTVSAQSSAACAKPVKAAPSGPSAAASALQRPSLKAIAHFNPFKLKRGHVVLKLKIPDLFKPGYVGLFVREARELPKGQKINGLNFQAFGESRGDIFRIKDANRLHATKPRGKTRK